MSAAGGTPVEYGRCVGCGGWKWAPWVDDLTAGIALVQHCWPNTPRGDGEGATMVGPTAEEEP